MDMRFGTWNVRRMYRAGSLGTVAEAISKYKLDFLGVQRSEGKRWQRTSRRIYISLWKGE
jgi:hypothetical protein